MSLRSTALSLSLVALVTACGAKPEAEAGEPNAIAAALDSLPKVPGIKQLALGKVIDTVTHQISADAEFAPTDTVHVLVATAYAKAGSKVSLMLMHGATHVASADGIVPTPGADGVARLFLSFAPTKPWAAGEYQVSSDLDGAPQLGAFFKVPGSE